MKGVYIVTAIVGTMWLVLWLNHHFWSRFPSDEISGDLIVKALSRSPRWEQFQEGINWSTKWAEARGEKIVKVKPQRKRLKAGRFAA